MDPGQQEDDRGDDPDSDSEIALDRDDDRLAEVVGEESDQEPPGDCARDVPDQKAAESHPPDPRHPAERGAQHRNEAPEEDGLRAVLVEELLRAIDSLLRHPLEPGPAAEHLSPPAAADDVAEESAAH